MKRKTTVLISIISIILFSSLINKYLISNSKSQSESTISLNDVYGYGIQCMKGETVRFLFDHKQGGYMRFTIEYEDFNQEEPSEVLYSRYSINFASFIVKAPDTGWMSIRVEDPNLHSESFQVDANIVNHPSGDLYITGIFIEHPRIMEINWKASPQIKNVSLSLYKNETFINTINATANTTLETFDWEIGNDLSGQDFQIKIQDANNSNLFHYSEFISIDPLHVILSYNILIIISSLGLSAIMIICFRKFKLRFGKS